MQTDDQARPWLEAGERALREGRVDDGIDAYRRALAANADLPDAWYNLAYLQRVARRFDEALSSYGEALARGVSGPEAVHVNRAVILSEHLERTDEAEAELEAALAANPRFLIAWLNLGNLHEDLGDPARAKQAYTRALDVEPGNGRALARLTAIEIFEGTASDTPARLRAALARPGVPREDAAEIAFALGHALDASGAYDEAFAAFNLANTASLAMTPANRRYDSAAHERLIDALTAMTPPRPAADAETADPPIFICGMFRSGSTLAEQILGRHSRTTAGGELDFIPVSVSERLQPYPRALADASPSLLAELRDGYLSALAKVLPGTDRVTDKRCDNFLHIGLIKAMFPDARIVHTVRNPLDNILSTYFLHFAEGVTYAMELASIVHWYRQYRRLMAHWKTLYGGDIFDLSYDAVVSDPERAIRPLLDFCGLEWEDACLATAPAQRTVRTASVWQVRQPLHDRSSGRWQHYARHIGELEAALDALP